MPMPFSAAAVRADPGRLVLVALVASVLLLVAGLVWGGDDRERATQPIAYNHKVHIDSGIECAECHRGVLTRDRAGRPKNEVCMSCHDPEDDPLGQSAQEERLREILKSGKELPWMRLYPLHRDVHFSHRIHAGVAELPCERCHGDMASRTTPPEYRERIFNMTSCLECHEDRGATEDCLSCHR